MARGIASTFSGISSGQRRTLLAAGLGWMLDAFDAMLYALVLAHVMRDLGMSKGTAGLLDSLTLVASGIGRVAFFVGILPALVVLWIRRGVPESEMWRESHREGSLPRVGADNKKETSFIRIFQPPYAKHTFALLLMNFFGMFAWWGLFTWIP